MKKNLRGIPKASTLQRRREKFLITATKKHNGKFDYSLVEYVNGSTDVKIICPVHGVFLQRPGNHLFMKEGCYQCGKNRSGKEHRLTQEEFIERARQVHMSSYNYDKAKYIGAFIPVIITCPVHGDFQQTPNDHVYHTTGCRHCSFSRKASRSEQYIGEILTEQNIKYEMQKEFDGLCGRKKSPLRFDFYLPDQNILIEFDGPHHQKPITYKGTSKANAEETHRRILLSDAKKKRFAKRKGIHLVRIPYIERKRLKQVVLTALGIDPKA